MRSVSSPVCNSYLLLQRQCARAAHMCDLISGSGCGPLMRLHICAAGFLGQPPYHQRLSSAHTIMPSLEESKCAVRAPPAGESEGGRSYWLHRSHEALVAAPKHREDLPRWFAKEKPFGLRRQYDPVSALACHTLALWLMRNVAGKSLYLSQSYF